MSHLLTVDAHLGVAARLHYLDKGAELLTPSRSSSRPGCRQARSTSGQWNVLGPLKGAYQQYPWHSSRRPDVDRCIGG